MTIALFKLCPECEDARALRKVGARASMATLSASSVPRLDKTCEGSAASMDFGNDPCDLLVSLRYTLPPMTHNLDLNNSYDVNDQTQR